MIQFDLPNLLQLLVLSIFGSAAGYTFLWEQKKGNPACVLLWAMERKPENRKFNEAMENLEKYVSQGRR